MEGVTDVSGKILVIDDEESIRFTFQRHLAKEGYSVTTAADYPSVLEKIAAEQFDLVFADILLPGSQNGLEILRTIGEQQPYCPVIMITGAPDIATAAEAVRRGAYDYVPKPIERSTLLRLAAQALRQKRLQDEKARIEAENECYRRHLDAIFRSVEEGILTIDPEMRLIEANDAALRFLQCELRQVAGQKLANMLDEGYHACLTVLQNTLDTKATIREYRVELRPANRPPQVVVLSSAPLVDHAQHFLGAVLVMRDITRVTNLERELKDRYQFQNIIGKSAQMQAIYQLLEDLSETKTTVLITGESGTGKELAAEALHYNSPGAVKPLIKVNCAALAESLLESELFGHVKGAFTGAIKEKIGRFQMADGGTIFLDEIGDLSPAIQVKLLRFLQEKTIEKVGDPRPVQLDVRVIAATNCNLAAKVRQGTFRQDLYYRLKVVELNLPPLRERREDIPLLVAHFCERFNQTFKKQIQGISDETLALFMDYDWPGNIRELEHAIEHAFVLCRETRIECAHLPRDIREFDELPVDIGQVEPTPESPAEAEALRQALQKTGWNKAKAARLLSMDRRTIYRKIEKYQIIEPS
jgi:two-component system response regulator HydG